MYEDKDLEKSFNSIQKLFVFLFLWILILTFVLAYVIFQRCI